jgi:RimK family alpha-L-glutamate ligase
MVNATSKKVLFLFADSAVRKGYADANELKTIMNAAAEQQGVAYEFFVAYARNLSYFVNNDKSRIYDHRNKMTLEEYDLVYFRKAGAVMQQMLSCAIYLKQHDVPFFDREIYQASSRNKLSQMFKLQSAGISIPATFFCRNKKRMLRLLRTQLKDDFPFPVIAKATGGTRGDANYLVHSLEELDGIIHTQKRHFLIQQFVPNDGDYRVLVMNGQVTGIIHRQAEGESHLNNTSRGGQAVWGELTALSDLVKTEAATAAVLLGRDIAGVDIIIDKKTNQHYCLEVNRAPQIEHASFPEKKATALLESVIQVIDDFTPDQKLTMTSLRKKQIIGRFERANIVGQHSAALPMIAKVDSGADSSSIHCDAIRETTNEAGERVLEYTLAEKTNEWLRTTDFSEVVVRSSNGQEQIRYSIPILITIGGDTYTIKATLNDRSNMKHDMLLGRRFLRDNSLVVDVARRFVLSKNVARSTE